MKKKIGIFCIFMMCMLITGCGEKNIEGTLPEIMDKLYEGISDEEKPMMLEKHILLLMVVLLET